jgi:hypothetical protein
MSYIVERLLSTTEPGRCDRYRRSSGEALAEAKAWDGAIDPDVQLHDRRVGPFSDFFGGLRLLTDGRDYEPAPELPEAHVAMARAGTTRSESAPSWRHPPEEGENHDG